MHPKLMTDKDKQLDKEHSSNNDFSMRIAFQAIITQQRSKSFPDST
jgi:hypothetical protein